METRLGRGGQLEWLGQVPGQLGQEQGFTNFPQKEKMNSEECGVKDRVNMGVRETLNHKGPNAFQETINNLMKAGSGWRIPQGGERKTRSNHEMLSC